MGQFLGFLRVHSSPVALVRNLHTRHISPQYHVVFDVIFRIVFSNGITEDQQDAIYENLFGGYRECYVKEEYNKSRILIYEPLPLDEV